MTSAASSPEADLIIYGTLIVVSILVGLIIWMNVRFAKKQETQGDNITIDEVKRHYGRRLLSQNFLWATWKGRFSVSSMQLFVKNEHGENIAIITYHHIPQGDVLRSIETDGQRYECVNAGLLSNKSFLRNASNSQIIMSCQHETFKQIYCEGETDEPKFVLHHTSVLKDHQPIKIRDHEAGKLISMHEFNCDALLLTLPDKNISLAERLFILASIPRR